MGVVVFFLGIALTLLTYGLAAHAVGRAMLRSPRRGGKRVVLLALYLAVLWPACLYLGMLIATIIPLPWGHAGEAYFLPYIVLTPIIFLTVLARCAGNLSFTEVDGDSQSPDKSSL